MLLCVFYFCVRLSESLTKRLQCFLSFLFDGLDSSWTSKVEGFLEPVLYKLPSSGVSKMASIGLADEAFIRIFLEECEEDFSTIWVIECARGQFIGLC